MKGNQGLEALAALCGGQSDAPTDRGAYGRTNGSASPLETSTHPEPQRQKGSQHAPVNTSQRYGQAATQQSSLQHLSTQQWQTAIAAASAIQNSGVSPSLAQSLIFSGLSSQGLGDNSYSAMQQYALQQYLQAQAKASAAQQAPTVAGGLGDQNQHALMMALAAKAPQLSQTQGYEPKQQVISTSGSTSTNHDPGSVSSSKEAPETSHVGSSASSKGTRRTSNSKPPSSMSTNISAHGKAPIAPMPGMKVSQDDDASQTENGSGDKKQQKRAANRKSAQLSRKRKKQYIEELKEENDDLRRKEQILRSIPDLIVVFDSSGKLAFLSQSVCEFLGMTAEELEGTSFWDRLCGDSVKLLKAAFMDSLAARKNDSETATLGSGVWELRLKDKDSNYVLVSLNGVVHFTGEAPECVCCMRPRQQNETKELPRERKSKKFTKPQSRLVSSSDGSRTSEDSSNSDEARSRVRANPSQSVISNDNSTSAEDDFSPQVRDGSARKIRRSNNTGVRDRGLSDGDSGDEVSESSGSDDGISSR